jgi:hypothetical protein
MSHRFNSPHLNAGLPEGLLYHYTTHGGLLGIAETKSIWATNIHYLNDAQEYRYAAEVAKACIGEIRRAELSPLRDFLDELEHWVGGDTHIRIHVCCFSERSDALSQWRAYSRGGQGYSVGFDFKELTSAMSAQNFFLAKCIYAYEAQKLLVNEYVIQPAIRDFEKLGAEPSVEARQPLIKQFRSRFYQLAPKIKHPGFAEEREWRLISRPISIPHAQHRFRVGTTLAIPYFGFRLTVDESPLQLGEIVVGPSREQELATSSAIDILTATRTLWKNLRPSSTPFRSI